MTGTFQVIDTIREVWPARDGRAEQINHKLVMVDLDKENPMHVMPRYALDAQRGEIEKFSGGQLNGKTVKIAIHEMFGKGGTNPTIKGKLDLNGK